MKFAHATHARHPAPTRSETTLSAWASTQTTALASSFSTDDSNVSISNENNTTIANDGVNIIIMSVHFRALYTSAFTQCYDNF